MITQTTENISVVETAKLVRQALKRAFPGVVFSVRSKSYSGGASINVDWTDGPRTKEVNPIIKQYQGGDFDGMIDLKYSQTHYLRPDGTTMTAYNPGTGGAGGSDPSEDNRGLAVVMPDNVRIVRFGADFVFSNRSISDWEQKEAAAGDYIRAHCTCTGVKPNDQFGTRWVNDLAREMVNDRGEGETIEACFDRVIMQREETK